MSRFGVFSLLLVLCLDLGRPSTAASSYIHDKRKVYGEKDERGFREKSQPIYRELLSPFLTGLASEDSIVGRLLSNNYNNNNDEVEKAYPNGVEETGFRNPLEQLLVPPKFGHRGGQKKNVNKPAQAGNKEKSKKKEIEDSKQPRPVMQNILERVISSPSFCKYVQNTLRKIVEFAS